jgi:serine/threonine protein kinase
VTAQISELEQGLRLADRYQVAERLRDGALCRVYRGHDLTLRRPIVIKVVPLQYIEPYRAALRLSAAFAHPAVICLYDMIEQGGSLHLIQEYVAARTLDQYLESGLPAERAIDIARQIVVALSYAHAKGIIHGDLAPAAVLLDRHASVRLNNFCAPPDEEYFARLRNLLAHDLGVEHLRDNTRAGAAGDIDALGYLLWLMITERAPSDTNDADLRAIRADIPDSIPALLRRIFRSADDGPSLSAEDLAIELERLASELSATHQRPVPATPAAITAYRALAESVEWSNEPTVASGRSALEQVARSVPGPRRGGTQVFPSEESDAHVALAGERFGAAPRLRLPSRPINEGASLRASRPSGDATSVEAPVLSADESAALASGGVPLAPVLLLGGVLFVLFFLVGFYFTLGR